MNLETSVSMRSHGPAELTEDVLAMTVSRLVDPFKHFPMVSPIPQFEYVGNGKPTHVRAIVDVDHIGPFACTVEGTSAKSISEACAYSFKHAFLWRSKRRSWCLRWKLN